jgi:hypothetical protein
MTRYALLFSFPLEDTFARQFEWPGDRAAIGWARSRLERFIGPGPHRPACSVTVCRLGNGAGDGSIELGIWRFNPHSGFEWTAAAGGRLS